MNINEFLKERISVNKNQFSSEEITTINENFNLLKKFYLLGLKDSTNAFLGGVN